MTPTPAISPSPNSIHGAETQVENTSKGKTGWSIPRIVKTVIVGTAILGTGLIFTAYFATAGLYLASIASGLITAVGFYAYIKHSCIEKQELSCHQSYLNPILSSLNFPASFEKTADTSIRKLGLRLYRSPMDGNCFYHSLSHQCGISAGELRRRTAEFAWHWHERMNNDPYLAANQIEAGLLARVNQENGIAEISTDTVYADQSDAYFVARMLNRPIIIVDIYGRPGFTVNRDGTALDWIWGAPVIDRRLIPDDTMILIYHVNHFMGVDPT